MGIQVFPQKYGTQEKKDTKALQANRTYYTPGSKHLLTLLRGRCSQEGTSQLHNGVYKTSQLKDADINLFA